MYALALSVVLWMATFFSSAISQELAPEAMDPKPVDGLDTRLDVSRAMDQLKPRERAMLWLAYAQGASHEEIARMVGVRPSSMKALLSRARRKLATALGGPRGVS